MSNWLEGLPLERSNTQGDNVAWLEGLPVAVQSDVDGTLIAAPTAESTWEPQVPNVMFNATVAADTAVSSWVAIDPIGPARSFNAMLLFMP